MNIGGSSDFNRFLHLQVLCGQVLCIQIDHWSPSCPTLAHYVQHMSFLNKRARNPSEHHGRQFKVSKRIRTSNHRLNRGVLTMRRQELVFASMRSEHRPMFVPSTGPLRPTRRKSRPRPTERDALETGDGLGMGSSTWGAPIECGSWVETCIFGAASRWPEV